MKIPPDAIKDHDFEFFKEITNMAETFYNRHLYKCKDCGLVCLVGKGLCGNWCYEFPEGYEGSEFELEELSCNDILIMDIIK